MRFFFQDPADPALRSERLWTQLWQRSHSVLDEIHAGCLHTLEVTLLRGEAPRARAHALTLMAAIEGSVPCIGAQTPWTSEAAAMQDVILAWVDTLEAGRH